MIHNRLEEIPLLARHVETYLVNQGISLETVTITNLCLEELLTNTINYGYSDNEAHEICIEMNLHDGELTIEIVDDAAPFDPTSEAPAPDLDTSIEKRPVGGLGIFLVTSFTDSIRYNRQRARNCLTLKKRLNPNT